MATPIVHASLGVMLVSLPYLIKKNKTSEVGFGKILIIAIVFACLPDIDLIYSYLLTGNVSTYHFGITHTIFFAACVFAICLFKFDKNVSIGLSLLVLSHVLVDSLTGSVIGLNQAVGIQPFLPFNDVSVYAPITLFQGVNHDSWLSHENIKHAVIDCVVYLPIAFVFAYFARLNYEKVNL